MWELLSQAIFGIVVLAATIGYLRHATGTLESQIKGLEQSSAQQIAALDMRVSARIGELETHLNENIRELGRRLLDVEKAVSFIQGRQSGTKHGN